MSRTIRKIVKRTKQEEIKPKNKYERKQKQKQKLDLTKIPLQHEGQEDDQAYNRYL